MQKANRSLFYESTGEQVSEDDPTLVSAPVYRDADGKLIYGWHNCKPWEQGGPLPTGPFAPPIP